MQQQEQVWNCHEMSPLLMTERSSASAAPPDTVTRPSLSNKNQTELNCLIFVNFDIPREAIQYLWSKCALVICADGGANRLFKYCLDTNCQLVPDYIKGDLDSIDEAVREYYTKIGVPITTDPSQDSTDLMKAMELVREVEQTHDITFSNIYVSGGLGGNISHEIANINNMHMNPDTRMVLFSEGNIAWYINPKFKHTIHLKSGVNCSVIPFAGTVDEVTTTGLRWNLDHHEMKFGAMVSTSNITLDNVTTILTSGPLVFIVDIIH
ncbi:hypothetical protein SAMD00019534_107010 [Acytostelium subglobosum LB1]|uniref:hypothetical protein n=1 Tax=Acytostelium subglobosum LB1 TaxID=1410327 RepID=UPI000644F86E|nr:hypothetical protein SAMD00019534_107010 [Acytostelium subglobosum LB1]GAM27525.1 hypothetical protein SAMD00019534_107010 [Acytostelium subglobosum LB1]|eukprot:XP_012749590.1 hypothetical protein SAMD00019534_107010 [Acytostelium subglobosum LB1]